MPGNTWERRAAGLAPGSVRCSECLAVAYGGIRTCRALSMGCTSSKAACSPLKSLYLLSEKAGCGKAPNLQARGPCCRNPPHPGVAPLHLCAAPAPLSQSLGSQPCMKCLGEGSQALCRLCCRVGSGSSVLQPWGRGPCGAELAQPSEPPTPICSASLDVRCGKTPVFFQPHARHWVCCPHSPCAALVASTASRLLPPQVPAVRFHACLQELLLP